MSQNQAQTHGSQIGLHKPAAVTRVSQMLHNFFELCSAGAGQQQAVLAAMSYRKEVIKEGQKPPGDINRYN